MSTSRFFLCTALTFSVLVSSAQAAPIDVADESELQAAITTFSGVDDTINFTANITLTGALPVITSNIIINGAGVFTLDADNLLPVFDVESGSVTLNNLTLVNAGMTLGKDASDTSALVVDGTSGSSVTSPTQVLIGNHGNGTLTLQNDGTFQTTTMDDNLGGMLVGSEATGTGLVTVNGTNSLLNLGGFLTIGTQGDGTLNIQSGGEVRATDSNLALNTGTSGDATVNGAGSLFTLSKGLHVGRAGDATLMVSNGGNVAVTESAYLGADPTATGEATVTNSGSQWNIGTPGSPSHFLIIGGSGTGVLHVNDAGRVNAENLAIGGTPSRSSILNISGSTSQVDVATYFGIGNSGPGTLNVSSGGLFNGQFGDIGTWAGGVGIANIDGAGSSLRMDTDELLIAYEGNGTLNLSNGGLLDQSAVANPVILAYQAIGTGEMNIGADPDLAAAVTPGVVNATGVTTLDGSGEINFNHTGSDYHFTTDGAASGNAVLITGATTVNHQAGTTTLKGANTYTGLTTVDGGSLAINGSIASNTVVNNNAILAGSGSLATVTLNNTAQLMPGNSAGVMSLSGNLNTTANSTVRMEIDGATAGTQYDQITVTGTAELNGNLVLEFGYLPINGETFTLVTAGSFIATGDVTNGFASITHDLGGGVILTPVLGATTLVIEVTSGGATPTPTPTPTPEPVVTTPPTITGNVNGVNLDNGSTINAGVRVNGATVSGALTNNGTLTGNITLNGGAVVNGGTISGVVNGSPINPAQLNNANITTGTVLNNVIIGPGTVLDPNVIIGSNVRFADNSAIPAGIDLTTALNSLDSGRSGMAVDLGSDVLDGAASIISSIRLLSTFDSTNTEIDQSSDGLLVVNSSNSLGFLLPVSVTQASPDEPEGLFFNEDGDIVLVTANRRVVISKPVLADNSAFGNALAALGLNFDYSGDSTLVIEPDTLGAESLLASDGSLRTMSALNNSETFYSTRPKAASVQAFRSQKPGLHTYPSGRLSNTSRLSLIYKSGELLFEQDLAPMPADWPALKEALLALPGITDLRLQPNGTISLGIGSTLIQGETSYRVTRTNLETLDGKLHISGGQDFNGDGKNDYELTFANGDIQILYIYP